MMNQKIGYIGLGIMGGAMARNLLMAGFEVIVYNRSQAKIDAIVAEGARPGTSPADVARQADIVFTNLPDSPDVEAVTLGPDGILEAAEAGFIFVDNSTIKPETARHIAEAFAGKGAYALDAPVSGGDVGARAGTLTIMVGGDERAVEKVMPALRAMGRSITHVGGAGSGQVCKACNQIMVAAQMVAEAELLILAKKAGANPEKVVEAIRGGAAQCWTLDQKPQRLFAGNREPGFKAAMQLKDLGIVMDTARSYGSPLPLTAVATQLFTAQVAAGGGDQDNSAVIQVIETLAKVGLLD